MNQEIYQEDGVEKSRYSETEWSSAAADRMSLQVMIEIISRAGYGIKKIERDGRQAPILDFSMFLMGK